MLTEIIELIDPLSQSIQLLSAICKKVQDLMNKKNISESEYDKTATGSNVVSTRFVFSIKNVRTAYQSHNGRLVVQGHLRRDNNCIVHERTSVKHSSLQIILSYATINHFKL